MSGSGISVLEVLGAMKTLQETKNKITNATISECQQILEEELSSDQVEKIIKRLKVEMPDRVNETLKP